MLLIVTFIGGIFRGTTSVIRGVFSLVSAVIGITLGLLFMGWLFLDELPLGEPAPELLAPAGPYLDMHVHAAGIGAGDSECFVSQELLDSYKYYFYLHAFGVSKDELATEGDQIIFKKISTLVEESKFVSQSIVLALDGAMDENGELDHARTELYVPNDFVAEQTSKYGNLLFGASVNPYRSDAIRRLVRAKRQGALLIKWIPSIMHIDPADKALTPFYLALVELDLPLLTHTGKEASFSQSVDDLNDPLKLELPLRLGVKVIAAHISTTGESEGEDNFHRVLPLFRKYDNLYSDISSLTQINKLGYLKKALELGYLKGRLIYGTDWPLQFFPLVSPWYHALHLSPATMRYLHHIDNAWDRDVMLKKALGVPESIFRKGEQILLKGRSLGDGSSSSSTSEATSENRESGDLGSGDSGAEEEVPSGKSATLRAQ